MKLDKAIELSPEIEDSLRKHKFIDYADTVKLGREALKRLQHDRQWGAAVSRKPLPGEDSFIDTTRSEHTIKKILESPLGRKPEH